ncbi:hypothetical protein PHYC_00014 [Phycisphaerales bacterium]|nr:hypothetical protein PHYC_00014 [Phycisphaerales bacterium]
MTGLCCGVAGWLAANVEAQTISWQIGNGEIHNLGAEEDIPPINVGQVSGVMLLRIWDPSFVAGVPDDGVGKLTIDGTWTAGELQILVCAPNQTWPADSETELMEFGVRDLGLDSADGIEVLDATLRVHTRLAAFTSGDVNGTIDVGQVQRLQCGVPGTSPVGTIHANITARSLDISDESTTHHAIAFVRAGNGITGTITALGDEASYNPVIEATFASIRKLLIGPSTTATGLQGDVLAERGRIISIQTTGPIGAANDVKRIWAGNGITEIRAYDGQTDYIDADFHADIDSGRTIGTPEANPFREGACGVIQTGGDLSGSIHAGNMLPTTAGQRAGVYVKGDVTGDITVDYIAECNIVAARLLGSIEIGYMFEGTMIATEIDDATALTPLVSIGYGASDAAYESYPTLRGFTGSAHNFSACPSINPRNAAQMDTLYATGLACDEEGVGPSIIAAPAVTDLRIANMTAFEYSPSEGALGEMYERMPTVEVASIGSLTIEFLREGAIWSGIFDDSAVPPVDTDRSDDFASVGSVHIGCIGQGGRLWVQEFTSFAVSGSVLGEVHLPSVVAAQLVQIGDALGAASGPTTLRCGCVDAGFDCVDSAWIPAQEPVDPSEASPRAGARLDAGEINIDGALAGMIVLNANAGTADAPNLWAGPVRVFAAQSSPIVLASGSSSPDTAPYYKRHASELGGGAVGLVKFNVHDDDCTQPQSGFSVPTFLNSAFSQLPAGGDCNPDPDPYQFESITVITYGPVCFLGNGKPISMMKDGDPFDYAAFTDVTVNQELGGSYSTEVIIRGNGSTLISPGVYTITPVINSTSSPDARLLCDGLLTDEHVPVKSFEFVFELLSDCNRNGIDDVEDIFDSQGTLDLWPPNGTIDCCEPDLCWYDYNGDGAENPSDLTALELAVNGDYSLIVPYAIPYIDFNRDGVENGNDVGDLENHMVAGTCP